MYGKLIAHLLLLVLLSAMGAAQAMDVIIAASQESPALSDFASTLQKQRPADRILLVQNGNLPAQLPADGRLILLGEQLLSWRLRAEDAPPTLILQISRMQARMALAGRPLTRQTTLLWSDPPPLRQLQLLGELQPHVRKIGVLFSRDSQFLLPEVEQAARQTNLQLQTQLWDDTRDSRALGRLLDNSDALLGLDDPQLFNPLTIKQILLASYDRRKALIGPTAAFIRAGSLSSSYSNQADWLDTLNSLLDQPPARWPQTLYPQRFHIISNTSVARSLGVDRYSDEELARRLQDKESAR